MTVTIHQAKTQLSKLIAAVEAGEEVIIARRDKPVVRLIKEEVKTRKRDLGFPVEAGETIRMGGFDNEKLNTEIADDFESWDPF